MNCQNVQHSLSAHLDGWLREEEQRHVLLHLAQCRECALVSEQLERVQAALKELPAQTPPPELISVLRVTASRERARRLVRSSPAARLEYISERLRLWVDNLMRPVALPFAGGLISAIVLFSMLVPSILFHRSQANDVPLVALYREATISESAPFGFNDDDFVVEVMVDPQGRMVDYSITEGPSLIKNPELRRSIENKLLFTSFNPATAFGRPTSSKIFVSFSRSSINVGS